jgi:hypothetical protein
MMSEIIGLEEQGELTTKQTNEEMMGLLLAGRAVHLVCFLLAFKKMFASLSRS